MKQDEIIEMAREAGWSGIYSSWTSPTNRTGLTVPITMQQIEAFTKLVAAKEQKKWQDQTAVEIHEAVLEEREACAKACEEEQEYWGWGTAFDAAALIRARGEQA